MQSDASLRVRNRDLVRRTMRRLRQSTRPELAAETGLSAVTIGSIISTLESCGEVRRGPLAPSGGGRPSTIYAFNETYLYAVALCLYTGEGGERVSVTVTNLLGTEVERLTRPVPASFSMEYFDELLDPVFARYPRIRMLGVGFAGMEKRDGILVSTRSGAETLMLHLRRRYDVAVVFENDVNAAAFGWYEKNAEPGQSVVALYFPRLDPPGAGMVLGGHVWRGANGFAGEFAHIHSIRDWMELDYGNAEQTALMLSQAAVTFCCTVAPDYLLLYGDFWNPQLEQRILEGVERSLNGLFACQIRFLTSIEQDQRSGVRDLALEELYALQASGMELAPERD